MAQGTSSEVQTFGLDFGHCSFFGHSSLPHWTSFPVSSASPPAAGFEKALQGLGERFRGAEAHRVHAGPAQGAVEVSQALLVGGVVSFADRSEEHTSELQSHSDLVCRLLLEKKKK